MVLLSKRLASGLIVVLIASIISFFALYYIGDPTEVMLPENATAGERDAFRANWGLDQPIALQYMSFLSRAAVGDFGNSFIYSRSASEVILERFPATAELAVFSLLLAILLGGPIGFYAGMKPFGAISKVAGGFSLVSISLPSFWVAIVLILTFAVTLNLFPATGRGDTRLVFGIPISIVTWDGIKHAFLPALNLALPNAALLFRLIRASVTEQKSSEYVKFARAKGVTPVRIMFVHILRNVLLPVVTVLGLEFGGLLAFAIVTESVFAWPGVGQLLVQAITMLDRPLVVAYIVMVVLVIMVINLVVDLVYGLLDPRVRVQ